MPSPNKVKSCPRSGGRSNPVARLLIVLVGLGSALPVHADTIYLIRGGSVEGTVVSQSRTQVTLRTTGGIRVLQKTAIRRISYGEQKRAAKEQPVPAVKQPGKTPAKVEQPQPERRRPPPPTLLGALGRSALLPGWGQRAQGRDLAGNLYTYSFLGVTVATLVLFHRTKVSASRYSTARQQMPIRSLSYYSTVGLGSGLFYLQQQNDVQQKRRLHERLASRGNAAVALLGGIYLANLADVILLRPRPGTTLSVRSLEEGSLGLQIRWAVQF